VTIVETVKACREIGIKVTVLCTSTQAVEECQVHISAVSHQEISLVPRVSMDMLKKTRELYTSK